MSRLRLVLKVRRAALTALLAVQLDMLGGAPCGVVWPPYSGVSPALCDRPIFQRS